MVTPKTNKLTIRIVYILFLDHQIHKRKSSSSHLQIPNSPNIKVFEFVLELVPNNSANEKDNYVINPYYKGRYTQENTETLIQILSKP